MLEKSNGFNSSSIKDFDTTIPEDIRSRMKWKNEAVADEPHDEPKTPQNSTENELDTVKVPVVELYDNSGEKVVFELLDTVEYGGDMYPVLVPYYEKAEEYDLDIPTDVFIMKEVIDEDTHESMLEVVECEELLRKIYATFKQRHADEFTFRDN